MTVVLALDLGTTTGFCVGTLKSHINGTWDLKPSRFDGGGMRFVKLRNRLHEVCVSRRPDQVVFEEVRRHAGTTAAHVYGGLMATLTEFCEDENLPYAAVPVQAIKGHWTGKKNASKEAMINECMKRGYAVADDNEADAIALLWTWIETGEGG